MKSKLIFLTCCALAAGLLVACGGDDDDGGDGGGGESAALTEEEFQTQASEVCESANDEIEQITSDATESLQDDPGNAATVLEDTLKKLAPVIRDTAASIGDLSPPEDLQSKLDEFVDSANSIADEIEADPAQFAQDAAAEESPFAEIDSAAKDLGLEGCGQPTGA
jgi:hypothetical protein